MLRSFAVTLCLVLSLGGCAELGNYVAPDVTLVNLEFEDLTLFETSGVLTVRIANENRNPIPVNGGVFNLLLNGTKVGKALSGEQASVPGLGTAVVEVPIYINNLALATRIAGLIDSKVVNYDLKGKLFVDRSFGRNKLRFSRQGRFDFQRAAEGLDGALDSSLDGSEIQ